MNYDEPNTTDSTTEQRVTVEVAGPVYRLADVEHIVAQARVIGLPSDAVVSLNGTSTIRVVADTATLETVPF